MKELNLIANTEEEKMVLEYLQENASDVLAEKINNGVPVEKDGKNLISKKTLKGFMAFASQEARKVSKQGATCACIRDDVVYGWSIHYFEEDSITEKLYNEDGSEYEPPRPKVEYKPSVTKVTKPKDTQMSFFDIEEDKVDEPEEEPIKQETIIDYETGEIVENDTLSYLKEMFGDRLEVRL